MINDVENADVSEKNHISNILIIESNINNLSSRFRLNICFNIQQKLKNKIDEFKLFMIYNKLIQFVN